VSTALRAENLSAFAKERRIDAFNDRPWFAGVKARPPAARIELLRARKYHLMASAATKDAVGVNVQE
jgi:hypothetical protein